MGSDWGLGQRASWAVHGIGAWVVHGSVHGAGWMGGGVAYLPGPVMSLMVGCSIEMDLVFVFWIPDPVMSLLGGCPMKWILIFLEYSSGRGGPCSDNLQ